MDKKFRKLSVIIPAYNESKTIVEILDAVSNLRINLVKEIVVIDDGSKDGTLEIAQNYAQQNRGRPGVEFKILKNSKNSGKTKSVKKGIAESTGDLVVIQDADLEYEPKDLVKFVEAFEKNPEIDFIYGNRFHGKSEIIYQRYYFGNRFITIFTNLFTRFRGVRFSDVQVCYKMAKGDIFRDINKTITSEGFFGVDPEITAKFCRYKKDGKKLKYHEIPIIYRPRSLEEGKKIQVFRDGFNAVYEIVRCNLFIRM